MTGSAGVGGMRSVVVALVSSLLTAGCSVFGIQTVPEPAYTVQRSLGPVQIRVYGPRVAAETVVQGTEVGARSAGFRRLAHYIFGGNQGRRSIAMTAPVAQSGAGAQGMTAGAGAPRGGTAGQSIAMTAPVAQARAPDGGWRIAFFMPAGSSLATLPQPDDPAVRLVAVPAETVAVLRYSGVPTAAAVARADRRLLGALAGSGLGAQGAPFGWFYDPPWTLPPLRRNEAVVAVAPD